MARGSSWSSTLSVLATLFCAMGGHALAKFRFAGGGVLTGLVLGMLVVPGTLLLAPTYQSLFRLHLLDTYAGVLRPLAAPAFGVFLFRQSAASTIPDALLEAARLDGAGEFRTFITIALLLRLMVGAFMLITLLGTWNNFLWPQIALQSGDKYPLSVAIAQLKSVYAQDYGLLMAATLVSIAPVLALFLLLQREFIAGLDLGGCEGLTGRHFAITALRVIIRS
ncbi:MAG: carbohydrate ABC transporter permease [Phycisphaerae bacterium]|nr:carbohydrate ABC transporter permease [Phycisphaerae bacterium]